MAPSVEWNQDIWLIVSDVDETVAELYCEVAPGLAAELTSLLESGRVLIFITGQGVKDVARRVTDHLPAHVRPQIFVGHCSGAEIFGFESTGLLSDTPFYSEYAPLPEREKREWRGTIQQLVDEFQLQVSPTMPVEEFRAASNNEPLAIMLDDRGPQITFEVVNAYRLDESQAVELGVAYAAELGAYDLRVPILSRAAELLEERRLPFSARLAGEFAIDFAVRGVSKKTAVTAALSSPWFWERAGRDPFVAIPPECIEIWGDKFSAVRGGTDRHMSEALPLDVRSISFRDEDPRELPKGYNIVVWDGSERLHQGLLEYLRSRSSNR